MAAQSYLKKKVSAKMSKIIANVDEITLGNEAPAKQPPTTLQDKVSVIIPAYNRAATLPRAMRSVLSQSHLNLELIIADDASTDGTEALVKNWAEADDRLIYLRQPHNRGAAAARNLGLSAASGRFIAYQDSDDEFLLENIEKQLSYLKSLGEDIGATFGIKLIYGHDDVGNYGRGLVATAPDRRRSVVDGNLTRQLLHGNLISPQTLLLRAEIAHSVGGFDERLPANNDWDYMLRLAQVTQIAHLPEPVVLAYISEDSIHRRINNKAISFLVILRKHRNIFTSDRKAFASRLFTAGRYLTRLGKYRGATACFLRALRYWPKSYKIWGGLILVWARQCGTKIQQLK